MDGSNNSALQNPAQPIVHGRRTASIINEVVDSRELLGSQGKVVIEHDSMKYELRLTRQGKLILTK